MLLVVSTHLDAPVSPERVPSGKIIVRSQTLSPGRAGKKEQIVSVLLMQRKNVAAALLMSFI